MVKRMRRLMCLSAFLIVGCQQPGPPPTPTKQRVEALKKLYTLSPMKAHSTKSLEVYRAQSKDRDTLVGVGSNGELFEGVELLETTTHPRYIALYALGVFVSPTQRLASNDGYLALIEAPNKMDNVFQFDANVKGQWTRYTWHPKTKKLTTQSLIADSTKTSWPRNHHTSSHLYAKNTKVWVLATRLLPSTPHT